jgi:fatty acid desaturase
MSEETKQSSSINRSKTEEGFTDPGRKPWVWLVLVILLAGMLPIWPVTGSVWGFPSWAVLAVFFSFLTSLFILYVILFVWRDPDEYEGSK